MQEVKVTKIQIGLWNAIVLVTTFMIASIPAIIIFSALGFFIYLVIFGLSLGLY